MLSSLHNAGLKKKKKAQCDSGKLSFIWGKMRTAAWEISPQIVLRNCSDRQGEGQYIHDFGINAIKHIFFPEAFCQSLETYVTMKDFSTFLDMKWRRQWHLTPVLLPGESHGWRSLVGCSPWGRWESDTTERLHFHFSLSCIGEGNGNPLQCSCLENPRDGGAWWAAVYGVTQSRTRLK